MDQLTLIQWNCRSVIPKKSELIHLINKYKPFIVALQETWLKPGFSFRIPGYACLREDRSDGYGGTALLINHSFSFTHFATPHVNKDFSIIAVIVKNICFVSVYIPHPSSIIFNEVDCIISTLPKPFIILGDFNSQHHSWGSSSNHYGSIILDILDSHNICVLNNGNPTRRNGPNEGSSVPDLSLSTPGLASTLTWDTLPSTYGSDHFPILITFPFTGGPVHKRPPRLKYNLRNADWASFSECIEAKLSSFPNVSCGTEPVCASILAKAFMEAADEVFPEKKKCLNFIPSPPWWDNECSEAVKNRKYIELKYNECGSDENFDLLSAAITNTSKLLKKKKFESWKNFCLSLSPHVSPTEVWRNIRRFRCAFRESSSTHFPQTLANSFLNKLAPSSAPEDLLSTYSIPSCIANDPDGLNDPFSISELKGVLSNVKNSAPGLDGIPYSFVSHLGPNTLSYFLDLINSIFVSGIIPTSWKSQEVLPILKPNKISSDPSSYRPIALSSVLMKIAEQLVKNRLEWFIETNNSLSKTQFGFRRGKCTLDSISIFITDIRLAFSNNQSVVAAFLDINSAYDNVVLSILKKKLNTLNVPTLLSKFIINILSERRIHLILDVDNEESRLVWKGLPQGSVLSPILYNLYTYDLEASVGNNVCVLQYADDLLLYCSDRSIENASSSLTSSLILLRKWLEQNGLDLSPSKSSVVLFSRMRLPPPVSVYYNNYEIPVVNQTKFLGVVLDSKLTGTPHCEYILGKCERLLNMLRCLSGVWWGAHPFCMKLIYNALIRSILDYGTFLLQPGSVVAFKKLDNIQSKALRLIAGAMKSSPLNALQVECCEPPLQLRRQYLADRFLFRALHISDHPLHTKLKLLSDLIISSSYWSHKSVPCLINSYQKFTSIQAPTHSSISYPLFCASYKSLTDTPDVALNIGISKNGPNNNISFNHVKDNFWKDHHTIYTDASKHSSSSHVGVGVYHSQYKIFQQIKLPPESSVFTGECFGLLKAVEYIRTTKLTKSVIVSDSMSALQALVKYPFQCKTIFPVIIDTRILLSDCITRGLSVSFAWVPGHSEIDGNVKADCLANDAVTCGDRFPYKNFSHDLIALPSSYLSDAWNQLWAESAQKKGKFYYAIQPKVPTKPWFAKLRLGKRATSIIIRMRLGHVCTPAHLARLHIVDSNLCECGEIGDLNHIFLSCPLFSHVSFYNDLSSLKIPFPTSIPVLLASKDPSVFNSISSFILLNDIRI